jgi:hypothetical protein
MGFLSQSFTPQIPIKPLQSAYHEVLGILERIKQLQNPVLVQFKKSFSLVLNATYNLTQLILLAFIILYLQVIPNFPVIQSC